MNEINQLKKLVSLLTEANDTPTGVVSSSPNSDIKNLISKLAHAILIESDMLAREVYNLEGPGRTGARSENEYVQMIAKQVFDKGYQQDIINAIVQEFNEMIS